MIKSFKDKETEKVYSREGSNKLPRDIQQYALRKLRMINNAKTLNKMIEVFGKKKIEKFISIVEQEKKKYGLRRNGGDPDLFLQNTHNPLEKFFAEVKAQDFTKRRRYQDKLNNQQYLVFPMIEKYLKCRVKLVIAQIFPDSEISNSYQEKSANNKLQRMALRHR